MKQITIHFTPEMKQAAQDGYIMARDVLRHIKANYPELAFPDNKEVDHCSLGDLTCEGQGISQGVVDKENGILTLFI